MPVSFNSPPRNFFLLGSSGEDIITNFFSTVDKSASLDGVYLPDEIRYSDVDQKYILAGSAENSNSESFGWFEKRDYNGTTSTEDWNVRVQSTQSGSETTLRAMELDDNVLYVVGKTADIPWVAKYTDAGIQQWQSTTNTADVEYTGIAFDSNSNVYACGNTPVSGEAQAFVEKFDVSGNPGWGKSAFMLGRDVVLNKISANSRGEVVAAGYLEDDSATKGYIIKLDTATGEVLWDRTIKSQETIISGVYKPVLCEDVFIDNKDQIYVVGRVFTAGFSRGFIIKYSPEGNIIWQKETSDGDHYEYYNVKSDGDVEQTIVFGRHIDSGGDEYGVLTKYSKNGDIVFRRHLSSSYNASGNFGRTGNGGAVNLDADPSFYYLLYIDDAIDGLNGTPASYTFGKVSTSGNGFGNFSYDDGTGETVFYDVSSNTDRIGRLFDGSVRNDTSDLITYPFDANNILFDDLATQVTNKKRQMDAADSFEYSGSPAIRPADFPEINLLPGIPNETILNTGIGRILLVDSRGDQYDPASGVWRNLAGTPNYNWSLSSMTWDYNSGSFLFDDASPSTASLDIQSLLPTADTTPFTLEVWAMRHDSNRWQTVVSIANSWVQIAFDSENRISCGRNGGGGGINARSGVTSEANRWYHIVMSYDGNQTGSSAYIDIYVDGVKTKSKTDMGVNSFGGNGVNLYLGRYAGGNGELLDGQIGEVRLYNKALNDVEVAQNYNSSKGRFTGEEQFGRALTNDVNISWVDSSKNGYKAFTNLYQPTFSATDGSWEFDGNGSTTFDQINIDIEEFTPYGWEMWFENYNNVPNNDNSIGGPSEYQVLASWMYPAGITLGGWTSSATNEAIIFWSKDQQTGVLKGTYTRTAIPTGKHHLFVRWDSAASQYKIYVDGVEHTTYPIDGTTANHAQLVNYVGKFIHLGGNNATYYFHGKIFETRLYTREVSEAVVFQNYNATKTKYTNEAPDTAPKIGPGIVVDSNLLLNYDFGNRATYDTAQNLVAYSENFGASWWTKHDVALETGYKDPFGGNGATKVTRNSTSYGTAFIIRYSESLSSGETYTFSVFLKAGTYDGPMFVDLDSSGTGGYPIPDPQEIGIYLSDGTRFAGATSGYTVENYGDGWWRISITGTATAAGSLEYSINQSSMPIDTYYYAFGAQLEKHNSPRMYIPTYGTAITAPTTVKNLSSSSIPGTITGPVFDSAGYFDFDGTNDTIVLGSTPIISSGSFTYEAWGWVDAFASGDECSLINYEGTNLSTLLLSAGSNFDGGVGHRFVVRKDNTNEISIRGNIAANGFNEWHHYVGVYDETTQTAVAYVDGVQVNTGTNTNVSGWTAGTTSRQDLGVSAGGARHLDGRIGETRIYNRALSATEVSQNFNATRGKYGV